MCQCMIFVFLFLTYFTLYDTFWVHVSTNDPISFFFYGSGEGNDNPLQCSCLENPRDGGAWWAAVYGVAQSRTRLK